EGEEGRSHRGAHLEEGSRHLPAAVVPEPKALPDDTTERFGVDGGRRGLRIGGHRGAHHLERTRPKEGRQTTLPRFRGARSCPPPASSSSSPTSSSTRRSRPPRANSG